MKKELKKKEKKWLQLLTELSSKIMQQITNNYS